MAIAEKIELFAQIKCYFERIVEVSTVIMFQMGALFDPSNSFGHLHYIDWEMHLMFTYLSELIYIY